MVKRRSLKTFEIGKKFNNADAAVEEVARIYDYATSNLRSAFEDFVAGKELHRNSFYYPFARIRVDKVARIDKRLSYGFVSENGVFETTLTRPDIFSNYYKEQFKLLIENHNIPIEIGVSSSPIPVHFAFPGGIRVDGNQSSERMAQLPYFFDIPDLAYLDDSIANGFFEVDDSNVIPLALFTAPRVDFSLHRLLHYTATSPKHFQSFVLFTNYQFYIDEFIKFGYEMMQKTDDLHEAERRSRFESFVEPGDYITYNQNISSKQPEGTKKSRAPQMPAYHLKRSDGTGITMVNIGVGPSNAKNITDHIAVLRPYAWLMLGHCAGLRNSQKLGDYVLAHAYIREDHVLDDDLPMWIPIPALAEIQQSLQTSASRITGLTGYDLKNIIRTGTVATVDNRNWELKNYTEFFRRFSQSRAIALDMESATIAANGFRFRVPYGTLLCVSDKPLHGELKLPGMADHFYNHQVEQHLKIGVCAMEILREEGGGRLHSRKLRSFAEVGFR
ncbi:MAG: AMP nucleosidase [Alphaproteobacteria bacterium]